MKGFPQVQDTYDNVKFLIKPFKDILITQINSKVTKYTQFSHNVTYVTLFRNLRDIKDVIKKGIHRIESVKFCPYRKLQSLPSSFLYKLRKINQTVHRVFRLV